MKDTRALLRYLALLPPIVTASGLFAQQISVQVPVATPLAVRLGKPVPMKKGAILQGSLMYPVYVDNRLAIPAGSTLRGSVIALDPDRSHRIHSRLRGDFTPFHIPVVRFDQLVFPDGTIKQIVSNDATNGAPLMHLGTSVSKAPRSFFSQQLTLAKDHVRDGAAWVTAPGRGYRMVQLLYSQLPYHPERIQPATMWTVTLAQPLALETDEVSANEHSSPALASVASRKPVPPPQAETLPDDKSVWKLRAYLEQTISSDKEKPGDTFEAVVAEPVFEPDHTLAVPEGSILVGTITEARPARSFGRAGKLRFDFRELKLPGGLSQHAEGTLAGADVSKSQQLQIDSEGGVQAAPKASIIVPTALTLLAARAFDEDGNRVVNATVGSNGFGIIGRVVGMVAQSRYLAGSIGFYAAGLSLYDCCLARGQNIVFVKNTRIEVTMILRRNPVTVGLQQSSSEGH